MIKIISQEDVANYDYIYVISFYDGYIDGCKYDVQKLNTEYTSFYSTYGTIYYKTEREAASVCKKLNYTQKNQRINK